jgi:hypothetical protein
MCPHCGQSTKTSVQGEPATTTPTVQKTANVAPVARIVPAAAPPRTPGPSPVSNKSAAAAPAKRTKKSRAPVLALAACGMAGVAALVFYMRPFHAQSATQLAASLLTNAPSSVDVAPTNPPEQTNPTAPIIAAVRPAKSTNDFKISDLAVQRPKGTKGSKLTYVTGVVENLSDVQRFGVKIELDLLDQRGTKIDSTSDYCDTLGARQTWAFRAQAHDPRSVQSRVVGIKEDN